MDTEQKEQGDQQPQQDMQEAKNAVKDGANLAKNVASGNYIGAALDGVKLAKNKKVRKIILVSLLIPIIVVVVIASSVFTIFDKVGDVIQGAIDAIINFFNPEEEWDGTIEVSDEDVQAIIDSIESLRINLDDLKLLGDLDTTGLTEEEIEEKKKEAEKKYIKKFFEAELTTSTLYANKTKVAGKTYGTVYVYRTLDGQDTENATLLTYMSYKEMEEKATKGKIDSIKKYYSIDSEGKLVIPEWKTTTTYNPDALIVTKNSSTEVTLKHVDYRSAISQYTTPTTFFIYLAMVAQNPEFVSAVTELVKDSKINLTIIDTITTETESTEESYTLNEIKVDRATVKTSKDLTYPGITTKTVTDTPSAQITYVKTWFCEQEIKCSSETVTDVDETEVVEKEDEPEPPAPAHGKVTWKTNQKTTKTKKATKIIYKETYRSDVTDRTGEKGDQGVTTDSFKNNKKEVKDDFKLDENSRFLGLIDNKFRIPNSKRYEAAGVNNLKSGASWLFGLLQKDYKLQNLEQVMRFVMQKYTGRDYGVSSLDWDIFEIPDFIDISDGISGGDGSSSGSNSSSNDLLRKYIHKWENPKGAPTNADGTKYIIIDDGAGNPAVGYGVDIENSGYKQKFIDAGYPTTVGGEVDVDFVDAIENEIINKNKREIESTTSGLNLADYQINALVSRMYNCGTWGAVSEKRGNPSRNFVDSYNAYWNEEIDNLYKINENATSGDFNHSLYVQFMSRPVTANNGQYMAGLENRRKSEWTLFQTGYYDVLGVRHASFSGDTVKSAQYNFPHYLQNDYPGPYGTSTIPSSGCGPTSLAMILAGVKNDPSINPWTVVANLKIYWPDGRYYVPGQGSSHIIFGNDFVYKYYGVTSDPCYPNETQALKALEAGYPIIGGEDGHILAIVPVTAEERAQGYKFRIMDSARGHDGLYKSVADANKRVIGYLRFTAIIKP